MTIETKSYIPGVFLTRMEAPEAGVSVETLNLGATIRAFFAPDREGRQADIILGHEGEDCRGRGYAAALIGRCANRIDDACYTYKGRTVELEKNYLGKSILHGGSGNYANRVFDWREERLEDGVRVVYTCTDRGEGGFPGEVAVEASYTLWKDGMLTMALEAVPQEDTPLNLTNHGYFNLAGHDSGSVDGHVLQINADFFLPARPDATPTGEILAVEGTGFDFRKPRKIADGIAQNDPQYALLGTFDHNFCLAGTDLREAMTAYEPTSGRRLTIYTDLPGAQLYLPTGWPSAPGKGGVHYGVHQGFAFETQGFPNAPKFSQFPSVFVDAGQRYRSVTSWRIDIV